MNIDIISIDELMLLHESIINTFGGLHGIRDISLLQSSLQRPYAQYSGIEFYTTMEEKISSIVHSIIKYHVFIDGNKRTGIQVLIIMLDINDISIIYSQDELVELALNIASGQYDIPEISNWINDHKEYII